MNFFEGKNMTAGYGGADIIKECSIKITDYICPSKL